MRFRSSGRKLLAIGAAVAAVVALAACDPPDGRDLSLVVDEQPSSVAQGGSIAVGAELTNVGSSPASDTFVAVIVPLGVGVAVDGTQPCSETEYSEVVDHLVRRCPVGAVAPGAAVHLSVTLTGEAAGGAGYVVLSASSTGGGEPAEGGAPHVVTFPFAVEQRDGVDLHVVGDGLERSIVAPASSVSRTTVANRGTQPVGGVTVTQSITGPVTLIGSAELVRVDGGATGTCATSGLTVTCTTGAHTVDPLTEAGGRWEMRVVVGSAASSWETFTVTHTASSPAPEPSPDRWPTSVTVSGSVEPAGLVLHGPSDVAVGETFEVNGSPEGSPYWGPYHRFQVPDTLRLESPCQGTGTFSCIVSSPTVTYRFTALAPGGPDDVVVSFQAEGIPPISGRTSVEVVDPAISSDLHPSATPPTFALVGEPVTLQAEVRTAGPVAHEGVVAEVEAPAGTVVTGGWWGGARLPCEVTGRTVRCEVGDVPGHSQVPIEVDLVSHRLGPMPLALSVASSTPQDDPDPWPDATTVEIPVRDTFTDLGLTATHPPTAPIEDHAYDVTYTVRNHGSEPATGVVLAVVLPDGYDVRGGTTCTGDAPILTCSWASLAPGASRTAIVSTWGGPPGPATFSASVASDGHELDPDPHPNAVETDVVGVGPHGDLVVELPDPGRTHVVGEQSRFSVRVRNLGPSMVPNVRWQVVVPDGWRVDGVEGDHAYLCTISGTTIDCGPRPELWLTTNTVVVIATPLEARADALLTATATGERPDPDPSSNQATLPLTSVPTSVDLGIEPWEHGELNDRFVRGGSGQRMFGITNAGPALATDVVISGTLPEAATITGARGADLDCTWEAHRFTCTRPTLMAGDGVVLVLDLAWADVPGPLTYELSVSSAQPEAVPDVDPGTLSHTVIPTNQTLGIGGVVRGPDGSPVAGAVVRLYADSDGLAPSVRVETGADGRFRALRPLGTAYRVSITPPTGSGWAAEWYQDSATRGAATRLEIVPHTPFHEIEVRLG